MMTASSGTAGTQLIYPRDHLDYPQVPLWHALAGARRRWPDRIAFQVDEATITWQELWDSACRLAAGYRSSGLRPGMVLALQLRNSIDMAVAYWASQLAGLVISPVNPAQPPDSIENQLSDCGATAVISRNTTGVVILTMRSDAAVIPLTEVAAAASGTENLSPHTPSDLSAAIAHISYTGGTTGTPKGVVLSQRALVCNALQFCHWISSSVPDRDGDGALTLSQPGSPQEWPIRLGTGVVIASAPWFHAMGLGGGLIVPALLGNRSLILSRFDPAVYLDTVERENVTSVSGAPALLAGLVREQETNPRDVASIRLISCGGGPLSTVLADRLARAFPPAVVTQAYGLTEVAMAAIGYPTATTAPRRTGRVGLPLADTEVRLVSATEHTGQGGEIWVRGPQLMLGYHGRPAETAEVLRDGWLRTGDIGMLDEDGLLAVVDRSKDMLIYKGYNVYPSELEALLREQPGVQDAAVVGVPEADDGEYPVAFVVAEGSPDPDLLREAVNTKVVHYKRLRAIYLVAELPTSPLGKTVKDPLRKEAARLTGADPVVSEPAASTTPVPTDPLARLNQHSGELVRAMGIVFEHADATRVVASMPVEGNRQGYHLLHGGASVVLAETVGSALAVLATGFAKSAVGLEVNATHHRSARDGRVTAVGTIASVGRTTATIEITVADAEGRRVCTARLTCSLRDRK
ncbi:AMP-binding protein [Nocardia vaccinii]|uniref:AMP-binding protein n=1 Tax=Nocardia vaccinii TaxID=1822 RepID=UPI000830EC9D|nr:AMP-binding protein [Nocardia vaccinii]